MNIGSVQQEVTSLLAALNFAAEKHRGQQQKKADGPFINHPIAVAEILARVGKVSDVALLQAAFLHDILEKTSTPPAELEQMFGAQVRSLVEELSDDMSKPKEEQKRLQVEGAPALSAHAQRIRVADKICNVNQISPRQPADWTLDQKHAYLDWAQAVVNRCRDSGPELTQYFFKLVDAKRAALKSV
jgi:guanosine-3',5'-bis(diphosphate) 3'-pyrophosphohydrolase